MGGTCSSGSPLWLITHLVGCCLLATPWDALCTGQPAVHQGWCLGCSAARCHCVNPSSSEIEAIPLGFNFDQVKCQLFFVIIRKSFNRFSSVALRSQEEIQGRNIGPTLSFSSAETSYIHPLNSWPGATLRLLKTQLYSGCSGKSLLTKCHEVYKPKDILEKCLLPFWSLSPLHQMPLAHSSWFAPELSEPCRLVWKEPSLQVPQHRPVLRRNPSTPPLGCHETLFLLTSLGQQGVMSRTKTMYLHALYTQLFILPLAFSFPCGLLFNLSKNSFSNTLHWIMVVWLFWLN